MPTLRFDPVPDIASAVGIKARAVKAVLALLDDGNTVPFIARYRKEQTSGADEVAIREVQQQIAEARELHDRKVTVLETIEGQGKLTDALREQIAACPTRTALEDLYLPYRPRRRTRATMARERGLEPLAERILAQPRGGNPTKEAAPFARAHDELEDAEDALAGARDIVAEAVAETAEVRRRLRDALARKGRVTSSVVKKKKAEASNFRDYFDFSQPVSSIPSHRFLAIQRGQAEGLLRLKLDVSSDRIIRDILKIVDYDYRSPFAQQLADAVQDGYKRLLFPSVETGTLNALKEAADATAIEIFAENLKNLLLSPPAGARPVLAIDPGLRTGSKCVALDASGAFVDHRTLYLVGGGNKKEAARRDLLTLVDRHRPFAVAVGNGTGGRETEAFVKSTLKGADVDGVVVVSVNESGASVYSASDVAREEFPDLDLTLRGAISIGRRFQDPLAELVKLDPKVIGVGQYQHDVDQKKLAQALDDVVESAVHSVGVDLSTASTSLLAYVSGVGPTLAQRIVDTRKALGGFSSRKQLLKVKGLGPKTFQQAAGFLRVPGGDHPLDASAVHPERYALVERIAKDLGVPLADLVGDPDAADRVDPSRYLGDGVGMPTLRDILDELKKPGRDPRDAFEPPAFRDDVNAMEDLEPGMTLEGVVTNVVAFGAFVDIGVHQDGLVHISELADRYVKDTHAVVKVGDRVKVRVLDVDMKRKRISLSRKQAPPPQ